MFVGLDDIINVSFIETVAILYGDEIFSHAVLYYKYFIV